MAVVAKHLKGFPRRCSPRLLFTINSGVGRTQWRSIQTDSIFSQIENCQSKYFQFRILNRRDPVPENFFMDKIYPPAIDAGQITRIFAAKGALRQYTSTTGETKHI
jgi:hypothetical protein